jgi:large conductance mechanosensitive channel
MKGFLQFVREQGVVGLAVGFILGGAVSKLVAALVEDIISPILALGMSNVKNLKEAYIQVGAARIMWGDFLNVLIDFVVIALVVYFGVKLLKLDKMDKKKE